MAMLNNQRVYIYIYTVIRYCDNIIHNGYITQNGMKSRSQDGFCLTKKERHNHGLSFLKSNWESCHNDFQSSSLREPAAGTHRLKA